MTVFRHAVLRVLLVLIVWVIVVALVLFIYRDDGFSAAGAGILSLCSISVLLALGFLVEGYVLGKRNMKALRNLNIALSVLLLMLVYYVVNTYIVNVAFLIKHLLSGG